MTIKEQLLILFEEVSRGQISCQAAIEEADEFLRGAHDGITHEIDRRGNHRINVGSNLGTWASPHELASNGDFHAVCNSVPLPSHFRAIALTGVEVLTNGS